MNWTLIILVYAGALSKTDSVAITHIEGFKSEAHCAAAGSMSQNMVKTTFKDIRFVCVRKD